MGYLPTYLTQDTKHGDNHERFLSTLLLVKI
jgi:hypothetical protein